MKAATTSLLFLANYAMGSFTHWDYDHMNEWSNEFSMCGDDNQSPINVKPWQAVINPQMCDSTFEWDIDFTKDTFKVNNNGHTISLKPITQTNIDPDHDLDGTFDGYDGTEYMTLTENENSIATLPNYFKPTSSEHDTFCLDSLHFHWGLTDETGSEHLIDDHQYPLELHFVHYSCKHSTLGATLEQFPTLESVSDAAEDGVDTHQLGVVGILFDVVEDRINPAFDAMFTDDTLLHIEFPAEVDHSGHQYLSEVVHGLNLTDLIPQDIETAGYYSYEGSLTTPPCTDIVRWHVMNARGYIGASQLEKFRSLMSTEEYPIAPNYREVQQNENTVYSCIGITDESEGETETETKTETETEVMVLVAIISSLVTVFVLGVVFVFVYKKHEMKLSAEINNAKRADINKKDTDLERNEEAFVTTR